jgi:hypothetical protein
MRFPWRQVLMAFFGLAFAVVILERAGGFSLILERGSASAGKLFGALTPAPGVGAAARAPSFTGALRPGRLL